MANVAQNKDTAKRLVEVSPNECVMNFSGIQIEYPLRNPEEVKRFLYSMMKSTICNPAIDTDVHENGDLFTVYESVSELIDKTSSAFRAMEEFRKGGVENE